MHAFELAARILKDDRFSASALGLTPHEVPQEGLKRYEHVVDTLGPEFLRLAGEWLPDSDSADLDLHAKVEETSWLCALLYGVGGLRASGGFIPDFYECVVLSPFSSSHASWSSLRMCADDADWVGCTS